jgi:hypothetical protein
MPTADPATLRLLAETLRASGAGRLHLAGNSMLPTLRDGWKLRVRAIPASELRVGDIGVFIHRDLLTIHRLVWKKFEAGRELFIFQGDNNAIREAVEASAILARVEEAEAEPSPEGIAGIIPVGRDERALFYRLAFQAHGTLVRWVPALEIPPEGGNGRWAYRSLRALFRALETLISPRPRR